MSRVFLDQDDAGIEYAYFDDATGDLLSIERVEDAEATLEHAKQCFNEGLVNRHSEFRRVASYPPNVLKQIAATKGMKFDELVKLMGKDRAFTMSIVNDRDLSGFRTLPGTY